MGSIAFSTAFVIGNMRVPSPAAAMTALRTVFDNELPTSCGNRRSSLDRWRRVWPPNPLVNAVQRAIDGPGIRPRALGGSGGDGGVKSLGTGQVQTDVAHSMALGLSALLAVSI